MPNLEPVVLQQDQIKLRHIGPKAAVWPGAPVALPQFAVLSRADMVARPLPESSLPSSPDFASGSWTLRLGDAGEAQANFPNATASDGTPWRQRFDPTGHLQFVEVYFNGILDYVGVIDQVNPSQQQVTVHSYDGWWLLKKAYERDWVVTQAPRDVIERGTQVWVPVVADNFPYNGGVLSSQWNFAANETIAPSGGVLFSVSNSSAGNLGEIAAQNITVGTTGVWRAQCSIQWSNLASNSFLYLEIDESNGDTYQIGLYNGKAQLFTVIGGSGWDASTVQVPSATTYSLQLESDGEWVWAFVNGQLVGCVRRGHATTTALTTTIAEQSGGGGTPATLQALLTGALVETLQPFLQRGSDKGDYVLPGDASTYPSGGLHARYFNDLDLQGDTNRLSKILAPTRTQTYGGSTPAEYANQQDAMINGQQNPAGAGTSGWSCVWFGSVWLPLGTHGNITLAILLPGTDTAIRVWIGKTRFGDELLDAWDFAQGTTDYTFTVSASTLAGTLPYGQGTVARDGWYPIKIEYATADTARTAPSLYFQGPLPYTWTDPGGFTYLSGGASTLIQPTSLSPLGCVDQRYQGISHFDLVQQTAQAYDYQAAVEPQQLESGLFPGVLAPRIREGHDTDIVLEPDTGPRTDAEGVLNYSSTLDSSDFASSLQGNGAGFQSGTTGQLQAMVYDPPTMLASLFDAQQWQDFSDAAFTSLLQALLNAQLGLSLEPWQSLSADPNGRPRRAFTWPLPGTIQNMRWRPGDGLRVKAPLINVIDTSPRQMLVVTRNITPGGITGTQATFANRPKNPAHTFKRQLYTATRLQRNYQRQLTTITGSFAQIPAGLAVNTPSSQYSIASLAPNDTVIGAVLRITAAGVNTQSLNVHINGSDQTGPLNGPWTTLPANININAVATPDPLNRIYAQIYNNGSAATPYEIDLQIILTVLR